MKQIPGYYGKGYAKRVSDYELGAVFPLAPRYTGALFCICKCDVEDYQAVLNSEEDIDRFAERIRHQSGKKQIGD